MAAQDEFTLDDFRKQLDQIQKTGPMKELLGSMPGMSEMIPKGEDPDEQLQRIRRMIDVMSEQERRHPDSIDLSRRQRIAADSGTSPAEVQQFLEQFEETRKLMQQMARMNIWDRRSFREPPPDSEE
jgi:signal recognition particle subunit SRP54